MRIAIANWTRELIGGTERYLDCIIPALKGKGWEVGFFSEIEANGGVASANAEEQSWCVARMGQSAALSALRAWHPDIIFAHIIRDPKLEADLCTIAPAVCFAHSYLGN